MTSTLRMAKNFQQQQHLQVRLLTAAGIIRMRQFRQSLLSLHSPEATLQDLCSPLSAIPPRTRSLRSDPSARSC
jgi:hypothetical protein